MCLILEFTYCMFSLWPLHHTHLDCQSADVMEPQGVFLCLSHKKMTSAKSLRLNNL